MAVKNIIAIAPCENLRNLERTATFGVTLGIYNIQEATEFVCTRNI